MANLTCQPQPEGLREVQDSQARLWGSGDNIPNSSELWIAVGTTPGGPYNLFFGPNAPTQVGNNTVGQTFSNIFSPLTPSTTYYYRIEERVATGGPLPGALIDSGPECPSFTTKAGNATDYMNCDGESPNIGSRNIIGTQIDNGPWPLSLTAPNFFTLEYSLTAVGPWSPATGYDNDGCSILPTGFAFPGTLTYAGDLPTGLLHNTPYFFRYTYNKGNGQPDEVLVCGPFTTKDYPNYECSLSNPTDRTSTTAVLFDQFTGVGQGGGNPEINNHAPCADDTATIRWGTTPGGPYPNSQSVLASSFGINPTFNLSGLTPSTTYYYITEFSENVESNGIYETTAECQFTTLAAPSAQCTGAFPLTATTATLNGIVTDDGTPGYTWEVQYGTTLGGPYPFTGCAGSPLAIIPPGNPQAADCPVVGLTPATQYYYITVIRDAGNVIIAQSAECDFFTFPNASANCFGANTIDSNSATLTANSNAEPPGATYRIRYGTTFGGPYPTTIGPFPAPAADQPTGNVLTPSTGYFYIVELLDAGNVVIATSLECNFTTAGPESVTCAGTSAITQNSANLNAQVFSSEPGDTAEFVWGTVPGGPYPNTACAGTPLPYPANPDNVGPCPIAGLTPGTNYYYRLQVRNNLNVVTVIGPECTFQTAAPPAPVLQTDPPTNVGAPPGCVTFNGSSNFTPPGCTYGFRWGTTPGGPYPNYVADGLSVASPEPFSVQACGLPTNTQIYYRAEVNCGGTITPAPDEQTFLIPGPIVDPCEPATDITPFSATLNATSENVPLGYTYQFRYGTTPGGPYPFTVSGGPSSGGTPDPYSAPVIGLDPGVQYYYVSEVLNPAQQVVASSPVECTFTTGGAGGFVTWCGAWYPISECFFVPDGWGSFYGDDGYPNGYWNCSFGESLDP